MRCLRDEEIARLFEQLKERYGKLDALVHSVAFAPAEELKGEFADDQPRGLSHRASISACIRWSRWPAPPAR